MSHGHGPSRSRATSLLLNRCFFLQEQTASDFLSQSQLSIEPLISGMLGGCPISKAYLEAMLYGTCNICMFFGRIEGKNQNQKRFRSRNESSSCHVSCDM